MRHPEVTVSIDLKGEDGNAFVILGAVRQGLKDAKVHAVEILEFMACATSGDYQNLLAVCREWVNFIEL